MPDSAPIKQIFAASLALLAFGALTGVALVAWFMRVDHPWTPKSMLSLVCAAAAVPASWIVWRHPSRVTLGASLGIMLASLLRVGPPGQWTLTTLWLIGITLLLAAPVANALSRVVRGR